MKFGAVGDPSEVDFTLPADDPATAAVLARAPRESEMRIYVGCAKWNKKDLKGFYPRGIKDELAYYSTEFNSIELNATFRKRYWAPQYEKWADTTPDGFKFCPKLGQYISHIKRLEDTGEAVELFVENASHLGEKMGVPFLQMHDNFATKYFDRVEAFAESWKYDMPIAVEFRKSDWYNDPEIAERLHALFETNGITNVLLDTAARRDLLHMRLTTPTAFVRWVGTGHESDRLRLDEWIDRIAQWNEAGLRELYFFVHQNVELESPLLSAYFIRRLNEKLGTDLHVPKTLNEKS
jgi:uncharacterized protein YecE (DUF72 family)